MEKRTLAQVLAEQMTARELNQSQLAEISGVPQPEISRLCNGITENPGVDICKQLATALELTVSQLIGEEPIEGDPKSRHVYLMMQRLPTYKKDLVVKTVDTLVEHESAPRDDGSNDPPVSRTA